MSHSSSCHRLPPELLFAIFANLSATALMSCALTCKRWSAPAIHTMWSTSWVPFEVLLKTAVPTRQDGDSDQKGPKDKTLDLHERDFSEVDGDRLRGRAVLMSRLHIGTMPPAHVVSLLQQHGTPLFPNIREISVPYLKNYEEVLTLLLSQPLKLVELRKEHSWVRYAQPINMIKTLAEMVPNLEGLVAQVDLSSADLPHLLALHSLRTLQYFAVFGFSEWQMFSAAYPKLETLILKGTSPNPMNPETSSTRPCFTNLETLDLAGIRSPYFIIGVLRTSEFPKLKKVALPVDPAVYPVDQYIRPLISGASRIEDVCLDFYFVAAVEDSRLSLTCLTHFTALKALRLEVDWDNHVGRNFLLKIPTHLPDRLSSIEHLTLQARDGTWLSCRSGFSCHSLPAISLQTKLPALQSLSITMIEVSFTAPLPFSTFPTVKRLSLSPLAVYYETRSYDHFGANLAALFPDADLSSESTIAFVDKRPTRNWKFNKKATEGDLNALKASFRKAQKAITTPLGTSTGVL